jgi:hypothetical protein
MPVQSCRNAGKRRWAGFIPLSLLILWGCGGGSEERPDGSTEGPATDPEVWQGDIVAATSALRPQEGTDRDWEIFRGMATRVWEEGLDTLPMGDRMVGIGLLFLGTPYGAGSLEVAGEEDVVVNFEEFDCVTFVENVLALARFVGAYEPGILESESRTREAYRGALREVRYRGGRVDGYPSRLHYFSDWIRDNEAKGLVKEMTREMGGVEDYEAIDYMTTHPDSYRQLANLANVMAIQETEFELSGLPRFEIPEEQIGTWAPSIQNGDIIAATSTVDGLDVAHTGLAYWQGSDLHLLHTPLVGGSVEVSREPLGERILRQTGQDGIRVIRPLDTSGGDDGDPGP